MGRRGPLKVDLVAAARPNFMKIAPLFHVLGAQPWCSPRIVHTGQHYDANMSGAFFSDLGLPEPDVNLGVGSGTHAAQTGGVMLAYEQICLNQAPDWIVVVGDVNSTMACALVGAKQHIPTVHLEAGLRSGDRRMPEEINRIVTDALADLLWTPSPDADENLRAEGIPLERIERIGNIMLDSFELMLPKIRARQMPATLGLERAPYGIVTLHRPSNVDDREQLGRLVDQLCRVADELALVFPVHPRTRKQLAAFALEAKLADQPGITLLEPLSYVDFMSLLVDCALAITDSGGLQEETTYLGIPCITVRDNTERPITLVEGTNRLAKAGEVGQLAFTAMAQARGDARRPALWDGHTAERAAASLESHSRRLGFI